MITIKVYMQITVGLLLIEHMILLIHIISITQKSITIIIELYHIQDILI